MCDFSEMEMNGLTICENLLFGAIASIIAAGICAITSQLYSFGAKQKINYYIENAILAFNSFENAIKYGYYDLAIAQVDIVLSDINSINQSIFLLTYFPTKKKMFYTFMNNFVLFLEIAKNVEIGYSGNSEKQSRCDRIKHYMDSVSNENQSWILLNLKVMKNLNNERSLYKALRKEFPHMDDNELVQIYENMIEINSFRVERETDKFDSRGNCYSKDEYMKKIKKITKKKFGFAQKLKLSVKEGISCHEKRSRI